MVSRRLATRALPWHRIYFLTLHVPTKGLLCVPLSSTYWSRKRYIALVNKLPSKLSNPRLGSRQIRFCNIYKGVTVLFEIETDSSYFRTVVQLPLEMYWHLNVCFVVNSLWNIMLLFRINLLLSFTISAFLGSGLWETHNRLQNSRSRIIFSSHQLFSSRFVWRLGRIPPSQPCES
jgi:hypothetical protein